MYTNIQSKLILSYEHPCMPEINVYIPTRVYLHPSFKVCVFSISYYGTVYVGVGIDLSLVASGALA